MAGAGEVQYLVLPDAEEPYLLARVRWPDVFQAISPVRPDWQDDPGLFDLPYSPNSIAVTFEQATAIAAGWGAQLPTGDDTGRPRRALMRRMPADWSNLSRAEKHCWSIEFAKPAPPAGAAERSAGAREAATSRSGRRRRGRREPSGIPVSGADEVTNGDANGKANGNANGNGTVPAAEADVIDLTDAVIDLTGTTHDLAATAEDA